MSNRAPWEPQPPRLTPVELLERLRTVAAEARVFHEKNMLVWLDETHADLIDQAADIVELYCGGRDLPVPTWTAELEDGS